jgi:hypothetical protein
VFLLSNIHDRDYDKIYPDIRNVLFDISDRQLGNKKNDAWHSINPGAIVCVVRSSRKLSTICRVDERRKTTVSDGSGGYQHIIVGSVVGKLANDEDMTYLLNKYNVSHQYLPDNKFSIGFNVADLGGALASLELKTSNKRCLLGQLESA